MTHPKRIGTVRQEAARVTKPQRRCLARMANGGELQMIGRCPQMERADGSIMQVAMATVKCLRDRRLIAVDSESGQWCVTNRGLAVLEIRTRNHADVGQTEHWIGEDGRPVASRRDALAWTVRGEPAAIVHVKIGEAGVIVEPLPHRNGLSALHVAAGVLVLRDVDYPCSTSKAGAIIKWMRADDDAMPAARGAVLASEHAMRESADRQVAEPQGEG